MLVRESNVDARKCHSEAKDAGNEDGACSGTRTPNLRIKSPLLYQLS